MSEVSEIRRRREREDDEYGMSRSRKERDGGQGLYSAAILWKQFNDSPDRKDLPFARFRRLAPMTMDW